MPRTRRGGATASEAVSSARPAVNQRSALNRSISTEEIREYFECPVCYHVPRPGTPIFACSQGHMLCANCRPQLDTCPICRISITEENQQRLYFAERLLEDKVPAQCKFNHLGCDVELVGHLLIQHENGRCPFEPISCDFDHRGCHEKVARSKKPEHLQVCQFRLVDCPIPECKVQVVQKRLVRHLEKEHAKPDLLMSNKMFLLLFLTSVVFNIILVIFYMIVL